MANIRATLELLVRILKENGTFKIKAETFRQSKFNEDGAVSLIKCFDGAMKNLHNL